MGLPDDILNTTAGAGFLRADMHIHSFKGGEDQGCTGSHDVDDVKMTPENIVAQAMKERLGVIAITDHNEVANVRRAIAAAKGTGVLVVPGVELSTPQGHLLVYFDTVEYMDSYMGRLDLAGRGTELSRCQTAILECLKLLDPARGFAVLAHIDGGAGFDTVVPGYSPHKIDVLIHPALLGVELVSAQSNITFGDDDPNPNRAQVAASRREALGDGRGALARVLFSDSHTLAALGRNAQGARRLTRIKVEQPTFESVRIAMMEADARVKLEDELPESFPTVAAVAITGGFLDGQCVRFSRNLTCIIGGRGTGKSTLLEVVRSISTTGSQSRVVDSEAWPERADLFWHDPSGGHYALSRRRDQTVENETDALGPTAFAIECYGQGEAAQTGRLAQADPSALLAYLDQFVDFKDSKAREHAALRALESNGETILRLEGDVLGLPEMKRLLRHAEQQLKDLADVNARQLIELERRVADDAAVRKQVSVALEEVRRGGVAIPVGEQFGEMLALVEAREDHTATATSVAALVSALKRAAAAVEPVRKQAEIVVDAARQELLRLITTWKAEEAALLAEIDEKRKELAAKGVKLDANYIRTLAQQEAKYRSQLSLLTQKQGQLTVAQGERRKLLQERWRARDDVAACRVAYGVVATTALKGSLADLSVTVRFGDGGYSPGAAASLQRAMDWRTSQVPKATSIVQILTVRSLLDAIARKDHEPLAKLRDATGQPVLTPTEAKAVVARFVDASRPRFELEHSAVEDVPRIVVSVTVTAGGGAARTHSREFASLSLGQQQSVLLSLMLTSKSTAPLLIDQPEDNLDGEFIFRSLVPALRKAKERRQVIIVTHNPNIAVLGDAELIVALRGVQDRGVVAARGSIDAPEARKMACRILEGAEAAFVRRARIYGLPK